MLPGLSGNFIGATPADMLRLNFDVAPAADPSSLGLLGGEPAGFPNGRRVGDDVGDIVLKGAAGGVLEALGALPDPDYCAVSPLSLTDSVDGNDVEYLDGFPYLGTPHQGYEHEHIHGGASKKAIGAGFGLLASGLLLGGVFVAHLRRHPMDG